MQTMQFYLSREVAAEELRSVLATVTKLTVRTPGDPAVTDITMTLTAIGGSFPLDLLLVLQPGTQPATDRLEVARALATTLDLQVATDLPSSHPLAHDPYCWCVADPGGDLVQMDEDMATIDSGEGLVLDPRTRRPLPDH